MSLHAAIPEQKAAELRRAMERLGIYEEDLVEKFVLGSGKGGQKQNKTSSCVYLLHKPSGIEIKCRHGRSQALNRYEARCALCDRLRQIKEAHEREKVQAREKARRQKRKRSRVQKDHMLAQKRKQAQKKKTRRKMNPDNED